MLNVQKGSIVCLKGGSELLEILLLNFDYGMLARGLNTRRDCYITIEMIDHVVIF